MGKRFGIADFLRSHQKSSQSLEAATYGSHRLLAITNRQNIPEASPVCDFTPPLQADMGFKMELESELEDALWEAARGDQLRV